MKNAKRNNNEIAQAVPQSYVHPSYRIKSMSHHQRENHRILRWTMRKGEEERWTPVNAPKALPEGQETTGRSLYRTNEAQGETKCKSMS
jgi:hypothetical protein